MDNKEMSITSDSEYKKLLSELKEKVDILIYEPFMSYKAIPKEAPNITVAGLVLIQIKLHLKKFGFLRLQKTGYFMNYFLGEEYFKFNKFHYGPYSHSIDIVARNIKEYQEHYGIVDSSETYNQVYRMICSQKTEAKLKKLLPAVEKASEYVNAIETDKRLEGIATVLYIVQKNNAKYDLQSITEQFKNWSEDKEKRFSEEEIVEYINYLEDTNIILKNICGLYEEYKEI